MRIKGIIHMIELDQKVIGIKTYKKINFFYFQNSQMATFKRYLYQQNWIDVEYDETKISRKGQYLAYKIDFIYEILAIGKFDKVTYYDKQQLNKSLLSFLNNVEKEAMMFLDLEMTMPSYSYKGKGFITEVIQAGLEIIKDKQVVYKYSEYIKPIKSTITKRAEDFLNISQEDFYQKAIKYETFYNDFNQMLYHYNPFIIIYGKNDQLVLNNSYRIHSVKSLEDRTRYINLCQLIKNFYELRNDPGLFKIYQIYYHIDENQIHDALDDATVTYEVFKAFKEDVKTSKYKNIIRETFNK